MIQLTPKDIEKLVPNMETVGLNDKVVAYRFTGGMYEGISYTYANIRFNEIEDHLEIEFEFVIIENKQQLNVDSDAFKEHIGNILVRIIESSAGSALDAPDDADA